MKRALTLFALVVPLVLLVPPAQAQRGKGTLDERHTGRIDRQQDWKSRRAAHTLPPDVTDLAALSVVLGRPTDRSVTVSVLSADPRQAYLEYGTTTGRYGKKTTVTRLSARAPVELNLTKLEQDQRYFYRLRHRKPGDNAFAASPEYTFHTQRAPGSTFTFEIQGDSHPERRQQFDPVLYAQTLRAVATDRPDFYMTIGDDFGVQKLRPVNPDTVRDIYLNQRCFLGLVAHSAPLFLVNGNHEQAAACNLDGTPHNVAVWAQTARNSLFPQPGPDGFYTGDHKPVEHIGLLRDYYSWTWGDALFVVIDPYWHSSKPVDSVFGGGKKSRDMWAITLGDDQYQWLKRTLEQSKAKYKFVFAHHVLGTGRGGIEKAGLFEWGGRNNRGDWEFDAKRPGWELPIHQLMVKTGVTVFFQGHDHVFVRQELDGVVYQTLPQPADPHYTVYNENAYRAGDILPNSGRVRVTVSPEKVRVEYVRSYLPRDATAEHPDGEIALSYEIPKTALGSSRLRTDNPATAPPASFVLRSPAVVDGGQLPREFTGDGASATLPLEWIGAPDGAKSFAIIMHHIAPDGRAKWYWILHDIPAGTRRLVKNVRGIGTLGNNSVNGRAEYAPPRSQGPGVKKYIYTVYALSAPPKITARPSEVSRQVLLDAMEGLVLQSAELSVNYTRDAQAGDSGQGRRMRPDRPRRADDSRSDRPRRDQSRPGRDEDRREPPREARFVTDVPDHPVDVILARPTANTMTLSVLFYADARFYIAYGEHPGKLTAHTKMRRCQTGQPVEVVIDSLKANTRYHYELREAGSDEVATRGGFHTQRPPGSTFTFTVQADSHLDEGTSPELYARTLASALADEPDFHIDLGDTFMVDKYRDDYRASEKQYLAQRHYFGLLCHSAPLFLVLGNHDGECGWRGRRGANDMAAWSNQTRKKYFPNPHPSDFYAGNEAEREHIGLLENYYAWEWGSALLVVLDPYWYTTQKSRQSYDGWAWTLGETQYRWLQRTLESSRARFKFVFIHHLVGGGDRNARGGAEVAKYFEWGGHSLDGSRGFQAERSGWDNPIHDLLRENHVNVVFHGHDHFFAKQELDGIIYQLVPQPGHSSSNATRMAKEYGYVNGDIVDGSGHLSVTVSESKVTIDFMRTPPRGGPSGDRASAERAYSYTVEGPR